MIGASHLLKLLMMLAFAVAPLQPGKAMAAQPAPVAAAHCPESNGKADPMQRGGLGCLACAALPAATSAGPDAPDRSARWPHPARATAYRGAGPATDPPPPRFS